MTCYEDVINRSQIPWVIVPQRRVGTGTMLLPARCMKLMNWTPNLPDCPAHERGHRQGQGDKWLWAIRFFKSRSQATEACKEGKVSIGEQVMKPSQTVVIGDQLTVKKNGSSSFLKSFN